MSIWSSIGLADPPVTAFGVDYKAHPEETGSVDVAVAVSFNDCVRLTIEEPEGAEAEVMLDRANTELLIERLRAALARIGG